MEKFTEYIYGDPENDLPEDKKPDVIAKYAGGLYYMQDTEGNSLGTVNSIHKVRETAKDIDPKGSIYITPFFLQNQEEKKKP